MECAIISPRGRRRQAVRRVAWAVRRLARAVGDLPGCSATCPGGWRAPPAAFRSGRQPAATASIAQKY